MLCVSVSNFAVLELLKLTIDGRVMQRIAHDRGPAVRGLVAAMVVVAAVLAGNAVASPGDLDLRFGGGDGVAPLESGVGAGGASMAFDSLGRIYVSGQQRLLPDGTPDTSYGPNGKREIPEKALWGQVAIPAPGRLVVGCGTWPTEPGGRGFQPCVWFGSDSGTDPGRAVPVGPRVFGGSGEGQDPDAIAVSREGMVAVLTGANGKLTQVWMFTATGDPVTSFGDGGVRELPRGYVQRLEFDSRGRLLIGFENRIERMRPDGSFDRRFGDHGQARTYSSTMSLDPSDRIVAAERLRSGLLRVLRFKGNGRRDRSFSGDGQVVLDLSRKFRRGGSTESVVIDSRGRIYVSYTPFRGGAVNVVALTGRGRLFKDFGRGGKLTSDVGSDVRQLLIDPSNRLLSLGYGEDGHIVAAFDLG